MYFQDVQIDQILHQVNTVFEENNYAKISRRTLLNQLESWDLNTRHAGVPVPDELIDRVKYHFFNFGLSDYSILGDLKREGFQANLYVIRQIRWKNQMKRRAQTIEEQEERLNQAIRFLQDDLQRSSAALGFGKGLLCQYVRQQGQVAVFQRRLYDIYRAAFPEEVDSRRDGNFKQRGDFKVPGPNFLWSLDGYEKLKKFGFQIYGCIDAYQTLFTQDDSTMDAYLPDEMITLCESFRISRPSHPISRTAP